MADWPLLGPSLKQALGLLAWAPLGLDPWSWAALGLKARGLAAGGCGGGAGNQGGGEAGHNWSKQRPTGSQHQGPKFSMY
jgi:hypothetical protein